MVEVPHFVVVVDYFFFKFKIYTNIRDYLFLIFAQNFAEKCSENRKLQSSPQKVDRIQDPQTISIYF